MHSRAAILRSLSSAALFVVFSGAALAQANKVVARVNGEPIAWADVQAILKARPLRFVKLTDADLREMQREALDMLIDDLVIDQFLRKNAPTVRPGDVGKKWQELQDGLRRQGRTLDDYCRETGQTEAKLRAEILNMLRRQAFTNRYLTDAAVRKYYDDNRIYFDQVVVRASHIFLRVPPTSAPAERAAAQAKLEALRQEIVVGKLDFAQAAKAHSQCPSAPYGGDLGYFARKGMVDETFAQVAFSLKPNEISAVVQSNDGLHLIKVVDRKAGTASDFTKIETKVRELAGADLMLNVLAEQRQLARIEIDLGDSPPEKSSPVKRTSFLTGR